MSGDAPPPADDADAATRRSPPHAPSAPGDAPKPLHPLADAALALAFLTRIPIPPRALDRADMPRAAGWFPLVGVLVGAVAGGVRAAAEPLLGGASASVLALAALVIVTGALHQDGLADCADGLGVRGDRAKRLAVMRDSQIGSFGMLALLGWGLLAFTTLAPLTNGHALAALIAAAALGRAAALAHASMLPPARSDGLGAGFSVPRAALAAGIATAIVATVAATRDPQETALALAAAALATAAATAAARRAIGGRSGDTLGATVVVAELAVLLALAAAWH
ncbi:adenosylcobinamide-GDP ribazoletransferase [Conexibacter sp. JD483]|uniref:adenosylcobinamide-GDP ribazoletransferase n=1 Tax=unclassified Conexibacter TaxID=2627773 RepID=UPI002715B421|nr:MULTISPECIES: adenosylcobinamide-GDP ribazoletransferase [unclassified Conexibacter]MDO8189442.1 adenosylcobinamide-GDP ribazoletransferase [Conexibacter sp. CPCC 205706]MDO8202031.1 adenosylcobinamide-GDP ribazoletransferase [Conexibacter sp. CPCC 205762]MDR9372585.1 adenosylcobinamide-GDP ribazoletransferase [Conexibacter sp. JD483]